MAHAEHRVLRLQGQVGERPHNVGAQRRELAVAQAADQLHEEGIEVEVINPRTIKPFDYDLVIASVGKTGKLLVVEESPYTGGWGAQVISTVVERAFPALRKAPARLAAVDAPLAADVEFEKSEVPSVEGIVKRVRELCAE